MATLCILADRAGLAGGGAEAIAYEHGRGFARRGWRVVLVRASPRGAPSISEDGMEIRELCSAYPRSLRYYVNLWTPQIIPSLRRLLAEVAPDVVHAHNIHLDLS